MVRMKNLQEETAQAEKHLPISTYIFEDHLLQSSQKNESLQKSLCKDHQRNLENRAQQITTEVNQSFWFLPRDISIVDSEGKVVVVI